MLEKIFGVKKPIIGMVHLKKLPNQKGSKGMDYVIEKALKDTKALEEGGMNGIIIENWEEDSIGPFVTPATARDIWRITEEIVKNVSIPVGINILHNDYRNAFLTAYNLKLEFVWLDVFVDRVRSDFKHSDVPPFDIVVNIEIVQWYKESSGNIPLFVQVHPKHYLPINERGNLIKEEQRPSIGLQAKKAVKNGADAIVITKSTGVAPAIETIQEVKDSVGKIPVLVGSGVTPENIGDFMSIADGIIVGTSLKTKDFDHVVLSKVKRLVKAATLGVTQ